MTPNQKIAYWSRWKRCAAYYVAQGLTPAQIDAKRHALTEKALGHPKSMSDWKRWTNGEVDKVFAAFVAIYDGGNLNAQLAAADQPDMRRVEIRRECIFLVGDILGRDPVDASNNYDINRYLDGVARNVCRKRSESCTDVELFRIRGVLQRRLEQIERQAQRDEAKASTENIPF